jgi:Tfp pilus assembly protein PilF
MDVTEATRFYHNALYAPWTVDRADARRAVRLELIRFLLAHRQYTRAVGELMALTSDLPDRPDAHLEAGRLFADAGDDRHALDQFERAVRAAPADPAALGAAGGAAFRLGQYALARTYLRRAPPGGDTLEVVDHVLTDDPLANRIGSVERRRRLLSNLQYLQQRSSACPLTEGAAVDALAKNRAPDQDAIEAGVELAGRAAQEIAVRCPPVTGRDRALALIARQHGAEAR